MRLLVATGERSKEQASFRKLLNDGELANWGLLEGWDILSVPAAGETFCPIGTRWKRRVWAAIGMQPMPCHATAANEGG